ncbi:MAG: metallopeptidase TldD-related protein [Acidobacteriota bacterium]
MRRRSLWLVACSLWLAGNGFPQATGHQPQADVLLRAMQDELERSRVLRVIEIPYYIEYALDEAENVTASATLGALLSARQSRFRIPRIQVRVGDYSSDNTNYVGTDFYSGTRYEVEQFPLDNSYAALRHHLWLATDTAYKAAVEAFGRKRAVLRSITAGEQLPDFWKAPPLERIAEARTLSVDESAWRARVRRLSALFAGYPKVIGSVVDYSATWGTQYLVTSEGTRVREPASMMYLRVRAVSQAPDGMMLRDAAVFHTLDFSRAPAEVELERSVRRMAENLTALAAAPRGETYAGPVLFEGEAAAQVFAEVLGRNLAALRRPVMPPGRSFPFRSSELEARFGVRILPEWMDVVDDPTQTEWRGRPLFGYYRVDLEGVTPGPLALVEKGVLKAFLLTRQPVKGFQVSNGRARLPGSFGAKAAGFGNLFVKASQAAPLAELKKKLVELCRERNKPYAVIVRKMEFPSSASLEEARRLLAGAQSGGGGQAISLPVLVYRLYPDGKEELVRGLRFRGLTTRSLKDMLAASEELHVFDYLENGAPFALMGAASFVAESSVIAPSVLIDDLEMERVEEELTKPPMAPPPPLTP